MASVNSNFLTINLHRKLQKENKKTRMNYNQTISVDNTSMNIKFVISLK